jgi:hypothetical protein
MFKQWPGLQRVSETGKSPSGENADGPIDNHQLAEQGVKPDDLLCNHAAIQVQTSVECDADVTHWQFKAWWR